LQVFIDRFGAKNTKASQAQSKRKQIERMDKIELPDSSAPRVAFHFPRPERGGHKVIGLNRIYYAYGQNVVYQGIDYIVERGQRTVLVGPNGAGKSTLLKLLGGVLPIQRGSRELGHNIQVGYCSQHRADLLTLDRSVMEEAHDCGRQVPEQTVRTILGAFLFRGDDVFKPVGVLSGGEKSRLVFVKLLLNPPNFLLLDEPTTHLDMASIEALIQALQQYPGTLLFISHDVYFIKSIATSVLHIRDGVLTFYPGNYEYYLEKTQAQSERAGLVAGDKSFDIGGAPLSASRNKERKRLEAEARQRRSRARKELETELSTLEERILWLELRQKELTTSLEQPAVYGAAARAVQLNNELKSVTQELGALSAQWERLVDIAGEI
jgi:ATP-binding cassette subfamily F protein 3